MQPGWYPDPSDQRFLRYWDGAAWTQHQAPVGTRAASTPAKRRSTAPLIVGILAGAAVVIGLLSWLVLSSDAYDDATEALREASQPGSASSQEKACQIELRTIVTAFEAYFGTTGAYPTSYDDLVRQGPNKFLEESPAERFAFSPDPQDYRNGTQGIGRCEGF